MIFQFANLAESTLAEYINPGQTLLRVVHPERFPDIQPGRALAATLHDGVQPPEIIWITGKDGPWLTAMRAQEGSATKAWMGGALIVHSLTAKSIQYFVTGGYADWLAEYDIQLASVNTRVDQEVTARQQGDATTVELVTTLSAAHDETVSLLNETRTAFSDLDTSFSNLSISLNSRMGNVEAGLEDEIETRVTEGQAMTLRVESAEARLGDAEGRITTTETVAADNFQVLSSRADQIEADLGDASAAIAGETSARTTQYDALAVQQTTLSAQFAENSAAITDEAIVRADEDAALASRVLTLETEGGDATAELALEVAEYVSGRALGRFAVNLSAGGALANLELMAEEGESGETYSFLKLGVSQLILSTPSGDKTPFSFDTGSGTAYLQNVVVQGALIENASITNAHIVSLNGVKLSDLSVSVGKLLGGITADKFSVGSLSAISANLGTVTAGWLQNPLGTFILDLNNGRERIESGGYALMRGNGFGASSDLIMWYGPSSQSVFSATKTNGKWAFATDGKVYYGASELGVSTPQISLTVSARNVADTDADNDVTTATVTVTVIGATGTPTFSWAKLAGNSNWQITAASSATTAFRNTDVPPFGQENGTFECEVYDPGTNSRARIAVGAMVFNESSM